MKVHSILETRNHLREYVLKNVVAQIEKNETAAAAALLESLACKGYDVQSMIAVDGDYTLAELHNMANYGVGLELNKCRPLYMSHECMEYIARVKRDPEEARRLQDEIRRRRENWKGQQSGY